MQMELEKKIVSAESLTRLLRNNLLIYSVFLMYCVFIVATTDDIDFVVSKQIEMPIINLTLPLAGTYIAAPLVVLILHFNILYLYISLNKQANSVGVSLREIRLNADRKDVMLFQERFYLYNFLVNSYYDPKSSLPWLVRLLCDFIIYFTPVAVLLMFQLRYIPSHDYVVTMWHKMLILLGALAVMASVHSNARVRGTFISYILSGAFCFVVVYAAIFIAIPPDDPLETSWNKNIIHAVFGPDIIYGDVHWDVDSFVPRVLPESLRFRTRLLRRNLDLSQRRIYEAIPSDEIKAAYVTMGRTRKELMEREARGINLSEADLRFANFRSSDLMFANFSGANLTGANFTSANLYKAEFSKAKMLAADLQDADLQRATLRGADLSGASFYQAQAMGADFISSSLVGATLVEADFRGAVLAYSNMSAALISNASLVGATLTGADLRGTTWGGAKLGATNLRNAKFGGADFADKRASTKLLQTSLYLADIGGADFTAATPDHWEKMRRKFESLGVNAAGDDERDLTLAALERVERAKKAQQTTFTPKGIQLACDPDIVHRARGSVGSEAMQFLEKACAGPVDAVRKEAEEWLGEDMCDDEDVSNGYILRIVLDSETSGMYMKALLEEHMKKPDCKNIAKSLLEKLEVK
ncbi:pentapeptide repeat-containing protein [Rhizobium leguminosarum]|uniref:pentapeptide repeat-containing protein n=1 Tax=Rhizobium leguminosarum TaxID=384 RepID=UPI001C9415D8|nr:pentapeptide repeat-containing protein [Rhizobium leguminosarum]MBY5484658.1 pentapeptide repeat-containing protein [Rhizobium leguminosarum]